jgi:hypothetical protein
VVDALDRSVVTGPLDGGLVVCLADEPCHDAHAAADAQRVGRARRLLESADSSVDHVASRSGLRSLRSCTITFAASSAASSRPSTGPGTASRRRPERALSVCGWRDAALGYRNDP